jgi:hypothetical protein
MAGRSQIIQLTCNGDDDRGKQENRQENKENKENMRIPVIPDTHSGGKPDTHSSRSRTPIPVIPDTP